MSFGEKVINERKAKNKTGQESELVTYVREKFALHTDDTQPQEEQDRKKRYTESLAIKFTFIKEDKHDDVILSLQRYKDEISSYWIELGKGEEDKKTYNKAYLRDSPKIAYKYRDELMSKGVDKLLAESLMGTMTAAASEAVYKIREKYDIGYFMTCAEILPVDTFSRNK